MPALTKAQLILVELAAAAALGGLVGHGAWRVAGFAGAAVIAVFGFVPRRRRWLYQHAVSWGGLLRRRRRVARRPGLAALLGDYRVESVPGGSRGASIGVVRSGTTWCLPLLLGLESVFNDDPPVPVDLLSALLRVEDIPLSSVRLLTLTTPAQRRAQAPAGPAAPLAPLAARYCLLTLDTRRAADAIAGRGGTQAAVQQILRRCAVHAEQSLATAGLSVRRLDEATVANLFATWMGPASAGTGRRGQQTIESWGNVRVAGTWSTIFAVTGGGNDVPDRVGRLAAAAPTPVAATSLLLQPGDAAGEVEATMIVRLSSPDSGPRQEVGRPLTMLARAFDLAMQRMDGEQGLLLRTTTPIGVGEPA